MCGGVIYISSPGKLYCTLSIFIYIVYNVLYVYVVMFYVMCAERLLSKPNSPTDK